MITAKEFKKKYPRQYKKLIEFYGKERTIFDLTAAVQLYIRGACPPRCSLCGINVSITKAHRKINHEPRCSTHAKINNVVTPEQLAQAETATGKVVWFPDKILTITDQIRISCSNHGEYLVNIGNFLSGMKCQKCYHESRIGKPGVVHSPETREKFSQAKRGKTVCLSDEVRAEKTLKQKQAWERRKQNTVEYEQYLQKLSIRRKKYQQEHGYVFPHREHTQLEIRFQKFLEGHGINFISQHVLQGKKFDFFLPDMQLLVEVDGEYWHRFESSKKNDAEKQRISENQRITLLRILSDDFRPELIFQSRAVQVQHTRSILLNRGIDGF